MARRRDDEGGFFLVWFAIMLVTLLALAGFAVDFWHWNHEGSRIQKASDAAALGGAVFMPDNFTTAKLTALSVAKKNGYDDAAADTVVIVKKGVRANQLDVTISRTVNNFFGSLVGATRTTVTKHAIGEYERSVNMGSPINQFGNDPEAGTITHGSASYPDFWANVFGPKSGKGKGDAILATVCPGSGVDNCSGATNADNDARGYYYGIEVAADSIGPLEVDAFDPAFAHVGDNCGNTNNLSGAAALAPNFNPQFAVANPSVRYAIAATSPYCSGDMYYSDAGEGNGPVWTTFQLLEPDDTPNDPTNNPVACAKNFPGYNADLRTALLSTTAQTGAPDLFVKYFRQWYRICTVNNPVAGTYFLQIQTSKKADGTSAPQGSGANRFSVRAGLNGSFSTPNIRVYGEARIGIYANAPGSTTTIYLARVLPGAKGRNLVVNFFDTGDAASAGTMQVLPPPLAESGFSNFSGCTYTAPPGNSTGPPWGTFTNTASNCQITNVSSSNFNGQWIQFKIPIPDDYDCNFGDANGCWTRLKFTFPSATSVQDTTTWTARIEGDPVRLVE